MAALIVDQPMPAASAQQQNQPAVFEFSKRKQWPGTIVNELAEVAILVFSTSGSILHCDAAVEEVIGYKSDDILGHNFQDFLVENDVPVFFEQFRESVQVHSDLTSYVRLKPKFKSPMAGSRRCKLFEIRASPYYAPNGTDCVCVWGMIAAYPTFNSRELDSFLPLKLEHEIFSNRLSQLKMGDYNDGAASSDDTGDESISSDDRQHTPSSDTSYPDVVMRPNYTEPTTGHTFFGHGHHHPFNPDFTAIAPPPPKAAKPMRLKKDLPVPKPRLSAGVADAASPETTQESGAVKRKRRNDASEGRVCTACGRNNSPEWRKGPQGPKTLCNACGLRWAKKAKRTHEPVETA